MPLEAPFLPPHSLKSTPATARVSPSPAMNPHIRIDLDRLPIKRLAAIEESGTEHFPPETDYEEKRLDAIRRIDFSSVLDRDRDAKRPRTDADSTAAAAAPKPPAVWPWLGFVEDLNTACQEIAVIIDLINTVEANDAVTVAGMQRPKPLPNEVLADLAVSAATKLQRLRHLGKYYKQSSKALGQQVAKEAIFYGSLIRLQQNWKIKRVRLLATVPGSEGYIVDLLDNSASDLLASSRLSPLSTVRLEQDSAGILAVKLPSKSFRSICVGFRGDDPSKKPRVGTRKTLGSGEHPREAKKEALSDEDVNEYVTESHSMIRQFHQSIFQEQVFDMVIRQTHKSSPGVNVTGMHEDFLQLAIGQHTSVCLRLIDSASQVQNQEIATSFSDSLALTTTDDNQDALKRNLLERPNPVSLEIYLQDIFHENVLRAKGKRLTATRLQAFSQPSTDDCGLLSQFCMATAHRIASRKVLSVLEQLVTRVPYLNLKTHPTWHSRKSSWSLSLKLPQSILHDGSGIKPLDSSDVKSGYRLQFHTKVLVDDGQISVIGEGAPSIIGSFRGSSENASSINKYGCVLEQLPMNLLQQVASQVIHWLHEEATLLGMKARKEFLGLYFTLNGGDELGFLAHVNPNDSKGCISWSTVKEDDEDGDYVLEDDLGHLSPRTLYNGLLDLLPHCSTGGGR